MQFGRPFNSLVGGKVEVGEMEGLLNQCASLGLVGYCLLGIGTRFLCFTIFCS